MEARLTEILQEKFQTGLEQATNEQVYYALLTLTKERIKEGPKNEVRENYIIFPQNS